MNRCVFCLLFLTSVQGWKLLFTVSVHAGVLQPQCERVAIEALQLCTLLLPPASRRKLQLLMRMMSRISQNVDMPRLHPAIGTRTLVRSKRWFIPIQSHEETKKIKRFLLSVSEDTSPPCFSLKASFLLFSIL